MLPFFSLSSNKIHQWILIIAIAILSFISIYAMIIEPGLLKTNHISLKTDKLVGSLKIAVISDIHSPISNGLLKKIVDAVNSNSPDFILIAGDINDHLKSKKPSIEFLNELSTKTQKNIFTILGDSDICSKNGQCIYCLSSYHNPKININATILRDSIIFPFKNFSISGVDYTNEHNWKMPDFHSKINDSTFKLLLLHNTIGVDTNYLSKYDLSISGNTHGGQIFYAANILAKFDEELDERFIKGVYSFKNSNLIVSSGIGMSFLPIRFGVPPEIILLTIKGTKSE